MQHIHLENEALLLSIVPECGGKITALSHKNGGRQWLWKNPHLPLRLPSYAACFISQLDSGGWDEIFPSVLPEIFQGHRIPDHGDLVSLPWQVDEVCSSQIRMSVLSPSTQCRLERTLQLDGASLLVTYHLQNLSPIAQVYLWCAHPLISLEAGMHITLPYNTQLLNRGGAGINDSDFLWPIMKDGKNLEKIPEFMAIGFQPFAIKIFTGANQVNEIKISTSNQKESLLCRWDTHELPHLGLWLNVMGWSGCGSPPYCNLGIEPTTSPYDSLTEANANHAARSLQPKEIASWRTSMTLSVAQN